MAHKLSVTKPVTGFQWIGEPHYVGWADSPDEISEQDVTLIMYAGDEKRPAPDPNDRGYEAIRPYPRLTAVPSLLDNYHDPKEELLDAFLRIAGTYATDPETARGIIKTLAQKYGAFCEGGKSEFQAFENFKRYADQAESARGTYHASANKLTFDAWARSARFIAAGTELLEGLNLEESGQELMTTLREYAASEIDKTTPPVWREILSRFTSLDSIAHEEGYDIKLPHTSAENFRRWLTEFYSYKFYTGASFSVNYKDGVFRTTAWCGPGTWAYLKLAEKIEGGGGTLLCARDGCENRFFPTRSDHKTCSGKCRTALSRA
jgi:hypothetical protein